MCSSARVRRESDSAYRRWQATTACFGRSQSGGGTQQLSSTPTWPALAAASLTSVHGQRGLCIILPDLAAYAREGDDLGGAQRLAAMAVDFGWPAYFRGWRAAMLLASRAQAAAVASERSGRLGPIASSGSAFVARSAVQQAQVRTGRQRRVRGAETIQLLLCSPVTRERNSPGVISLAGDGGIAHASARVGRESAAAFAPRQCPVSTSGRQDGEAAAGRARQRPLASVDRGAYSSGRDVSHFAHTSDAGDLMVGQS